MADKVASKCPSFNSWGGKFSPGLLDLFLNQWQTSPEDQTWAVWEFIDRMSMTRGEFPYPQSERAERLRALERLEIFGEWGHLSLRRDHDHLYWHFIGPADFAPPDQKEFDPAPYFTSDPGKDYLCSEKKALLWGKKIKDKTVWFEDRVAWAKLDYPGVSSERVQLRFREYTRAGHLEFVWFLGLE